jgi:hypothetical protein
MIKMEIKILIKDVIINESDHLNTFLKGQKFTSTFQYVFFEFDSNFFHWMCLERLKKKCTTHSSCKKLICNKTINL